MELEVNSRKRKLSSGRNPPNLTPPPPPPPETHYPDETGSEIGHTWTAEEVIKHRLALRKLSITRAQTHEVEEERALTNEVKATLKNRDTCRKIIQRIGEDKLRHGVYQLKSDQITSLNLDEYPYKTKKLRAQAKERNQPTTVSIGEGPSKRPGGASQALDSTRQSNLPSQKGHRPLKAGSIRSVPSPTPPTQNASLENTEVRHSVANTSPGASQEVLPIPKQRPVSDITPGSQLISLPIKEIQHSSRQSQIVDISPAPLSYPEFTLENRGRTRDAILPLPTSEPSTPASLFPLLPLQSGQSVLNEGRLSQIIKDIKPQEDLRQQNEVQASEKIPARLSETEKDKLIKELEARLRTARKKTQAAVQRNSDLSDDKRELGKKIEELKDDLVSATSGLPTRDIQLLGLQIQLENANSDLASAIAENKELRQKLAAVESSRAEGGESGQGEM